MGCVKNKRKPLGITESIYTKFFTHLKEEEAQVDTKLSALQNAQDNYYITANYILELSKRAYKLFLSSEMEERRQLLKLVFQNLTLDGKKVRIVAQKPFDTIFKCANSLAWGGQPESNRQPPPPQGGALTN